MSEGLTRRNSRPGSSPESLGICTVAASETNFDQTAVAEEVAVDITFSMFDDVLTGNEISEDLRAKVPAEVLERIQAIAEQNSRLKGKNDQLQAQLASALGEKDEVESRHHAAQKSIEDHRQQADSLMQQTKAVGRELEEAKTNGVALQMKLSAAHDELEAAKSSSHERMVQLEDRLKASQSEIASLRTQLSNAKSQPTQSLNTGTSSREQAVETECDAMRDQNSALESQITALQVRLAEAQAIIAEQSEEAMRKDASSAQHTIDLPGKAAKRNHCWLRLTNKSLY